MKTSLIIFSAATALMIHSSYAQDCSVPPTCGSLGFTMTAAQCGKAPMLKCPFDETAVYCVNCAALGYTKTVNECKNLRRVMTACPYDETRVKCDTCDNKGSGNPGDYCIVQMEGINSVFNGMYSYKALGCLPCNFGFSCATGLVFNDDCQCCDFPK